MRPQGSPADRCRRIVAFELRQAALGAMQVALDRPGELRPYGVALLVVAGAVWATKEDVEREQLAHLAAEWVGDWLRGTAEELGLMPEEPETPCDAPN